MIDLTRTSPSFVYINFACVVRPVISGAHLYLAVAAMTLKNMVTLSSDLCQPNIHVRNCIFI